MSIYIKVCNLVMVMVYLSSLIKPILAGSIRSYDLQLDYSNIGYTSLYTMTFQVETNFLDQSNDAIRLIFPNPIHNTTQTLAQQLLSVQLSYLDKSTPPTTVNLAVQKMRYDSQGRYYFFFNYKLDNTITYTLAIQATALGSVLQTQLLTGDSILEFETIMNYDSDNSFIYDYNPMFAVLRYTLAPERNIQFAVDATVSDFAFKPGGIYPVFFNLITTKVYYGRMKFEISFINSEFQLTQFCYSVKDTLIDALEPSLYTCNLIGGKLVFEYFNEQIPQNFAIRIATIAQNSNRIVQNIGFVLRVILKDGSHITDEVLKENMFGLQQIFLSKTSVSIAHGIPIDTQLAPNFLICLIRNSSPDQGYSSIFNAIKFLFQVNQDTPIGQELELQFLIPQSSDSDLDSYVLLQSISENFPNLSDTQEVQCTVTNNLVKPRNRFIRCINVGQLTAAKDFSIGFRLYLAYDSSQSNMPNNFSQLNILTVSYDSNGVRSLDSINLNAQQTITKAVVRTLNSNNWSYSYYNQTVVSTQVYDSVKKTAQFKRPYQSGGTLGIQASSTPMKLIFSLDIANSDLTSVGMSIPQQVPLSAGVYIICNPKIAFDTNTEINSYSLLNQNITHSISYASNLFTSVMVYASYTDALSKLFTRNDFSITPVTINFKTTPYVLDSLLDFYIMTYDQILSDTSTLYGQILTNAYTIDFGIPNSSYKLAIINQYKGKDFGNQPSVVPTLLKVQIQFSSSDISAGNKGFIIFFDGASFIDDTINDQSILTTPQIIECGSNILESTVNYNGYRTIQASLTKDINHGLIYQNMNQLIISNKTLSSATSITVLLPLQLSQHSDQMHVYVATIELNLDYKVLMKDHYYTYDQVYRLSASSQNLIEGNNVMKRRLIFGNNLNTLSGFPSSSNFLDITSISIQLKLSTQKVGDQSSMPIDLKFSDKDQTYYYKNDDVTTFLQGSAFTFIASWNFFTTKTDQDSVFFSANFKTIQADNTYVIQTRYIMYCPLQASDTTIQSYTVNNFILPSKAIETPSDTTFSISNARGYLRYATQLKQTINNPNYLTITTESGKLFWGSKDNLIKYKISQLNSAIPLEKGMKVRIVVDFKKVYIIPGYQCLFYDPQANVYETACRVEYNASLNANQIDFFLEDTCSKCSFSSTFYLYHYGNEIIAGGNTDVDKTFKVQLCINFGQSDCLILAQTDVNLVPPTKLNIHNYSIDYTPQTKNSASQISLNFGFTYVNVQGVLFNANIFDRIILNLGTFGVFNQQLFDPSVMTRICKVLLDNGDGTSQVISFFSSLEVVQSNTGGSLLLNIKSDLKDSNLFIFQCTNVYFPAQTIILPINIQIKSYDYRNIYQQSNDYVFNTPFIQSKQFALGYPLITKIMGNSQGSIATISFTIQTQSTTCKVNSIHVDCFLEGNNALRVSGIPQQTSNTLVVILSGLRIPKYNQNAAFSFKVVFDYTNPTDYEEGMANPIPLSITQTQPLIINSMSLDNTIQDNLSTYSFYLTVNQTFVTSQTYFQIDFPSIWELNNDEDVSQCMIQNVSTGNILGQFCRREGSHVIFKIYSGTLETTTQSSLSILRLQITNINNPEVWDSNLIFIKPSVSLIDSITGAAVYFGDSYIMNSEKVNFQPQTNKQYLGWFDQNGNQIYEVDAVNGVYDTQIFLRPIDTTQIFQGQISISLSDTSLQKLSIYPSQAACQIGDQSMQIFIGGKSDTREGQYIAMFYKIADTFNLYANIPSLQINVINQMVSISFSIPKLKLPLLGTSPPILLDLSNNMIMDSITVMPKDNSSIEVLQGQQMQFNSYTYKQTFQFQVKDNLQINGFQIEFIITGRGDQFISADNKISVEIDKTEQQFAKLVITNDVTKAGTTSYPIDFQCSIQGVIYYRLSQNSEPPAAISTIKDKAVTQYQVIQDQFNLIEKYGFVVSNSVKVTIVMNNLISLQYYKIEGFCETFKGDRSDKTNLEFQTSDNSSLLNQFTINFSQTLSVTQKRKLCCVLSDFLTIPQSLIYLREGIKCKDSQLRTSFITPQPIAKESAGKTVIYFAPLNYLSNIKFFNYMVSAIGNTDNFKSILQAYVPGLPNIDSISSVASVDYSAVSFDLTVPDQISPGVQNVTISYLKLTQNGFIYLALEELSDQSIIPDPSQLRRGVNYQGTVFKNGMQVVYQNNLLYKQSVFFFDQLKNGTHYIIYFMGGSEYQDDLTTFTEVFTRQFQTKTQLQTEFTIDSSSTKLKQFPCIILILILLILS